MTPTRPCFPNGRGVLTFAVTSGKAKIPTAFLKPSEWDGSPGEWETVCAFLRNLRWNVKEDEITSICELTALFHFSAHKFDNRSPETTYLDYHRKLRRAIVLLSRSVLVQAVPGTISATLGPRRQVERCRKDRLLEPFRMFVTML